MLNIKNKILFYFCNKEQLFDNQLFKKFCVVAIMHCSNKIVPHTSTWR